MNEALKTLALSPAASYHGLTLTPTWQGQTEPRPLLLASGRYKTSFPSDANALFACTRSSSRRADNRAAAPEEELEEEPTAGS